MSDPYKILQVDPEAEHEVIEAAYRRLARKYHPDISPNPDSLQRMIAINQAWEQLRDPIKRAALDRTRMRTTGAASWAAAAEAHKRTAGSGSASTRHQQPTASSPQPTRPAPPATGPASSGARVGSRPFGSMSEPASQGSAEDAAGAGPTAWTSGRAPIGGFSSGASSRPDGEGSAGPPPGNPSGSVLNFGRYSGWSLGEIARHEVDYLEWLDRMPIGRTYQQEIDEILRAKGRRAAQNARDQGRGGPFRRR